MVLFILWSWSKASEPACESLFGPVAQMQTLVDSVHYFVRFVDMELCNAFMSMMYFE